MLLKPRKNERMQTRRTACAFSSCFCFSNRMAPWERKRGFFNFIQLLKLAGTTATWEKKQKQTPNQTPFPSECGKLRFPLSNSADFVCLQWLVGNVVQRDDALYARMKQREIDAYDSMWDPLFVDDAALGLGEQRNKVLEVLKVKTYCHSIWIKADQRKKKTL